MSTKHMDCFCLSGMKRLIDVRKQKNLTKFKAILKKDMKKAAKNDC